MDELVVDVSVGEGVALPLPAEQVEAAVRRAVRAEGHEAAEISVALVGDAQIAELNQDYLDHEGPTDVISFALHDEGEAPLGDVYVGVPQALRQAAELGVDPREEVLRLAVHGTLHVLGYEHPEGEERMESEMFRRQEEILRSVLAGDTGS
ncbi:MAG: rRNA maturation RNase YbeY [Gemmatimonadetes bacterium]|nr:rRNA maturation RNase YbeY [Gemmatimonadota bacterium]